jgi:hypothetical protein
MFRKFGLLFAAMVLSMSMLAGLAGSAGAENPNIYYVPGASTSVTTTQSCEFNQGGQRSGQQTVTTTTTVLLAYNEESGRPVPGQNSSEQTVVYGTCANVPGRQ